MTTATFSINTDSSDRTVVFCGILSIGLHILLLAGLDIAQRSEPLKETVQLVNVTLLPTEIDPETTTPNDQTLLPVTPPMRNTPRPSTSYSMSAPTPPIVSHPQPIMTSSALELPPTLLTTVKPLTPPRKKRMLKDTAASDALFAQQATRMVQRTIVTETLPSATSRMPNLQIPNLPRTKSLPNSAQSIHAAPAETQPARRRRLAAKPPTNTGPVIKKIGVRHSVTPVYPRIAIEKGWEGTVILRLLVTSNGLPNAITVRKSSGHAVLDKAAIEAMQQWRFTPAMDGNFAVEKYVDVPLRFGLHR